MAAQKQTSNFLVVLGATGYQGGAVLRYLIQQKDSLKTPYQLRGITRNPESTASISLKKAGVEMVAADLDDIDSLRRAFNGATHIFANTDSNRVMFDVTQHPEKKSPDQSPAEYATAIERGYGLSIIEAAASTHTLQRIVWSGLPSPRKWSNGKYTKVVMFDVKEEIADLFRARAELQDKFSMVLIGFYANDALAIPKVFAPKKVAEGKYELSMPMSAETSVPMANMEADLGSWILALFQAEPGVVLLGSSEDITWPQWLEQWGQHNRVHTTYRQVSADEFAPDLGELREALVQEFKFIEEFGFLGGIANAVYPAQLREKGIPILTTPVKQNIQTQDWSAIL